MKSMRNVTHTRTLGATIMGLIFCLSINNVSPKDLGVKKDGGGRTKMVIYSNFHSVATKVSI